MISFFRKIRQNLLNEGKTGRYIKYAIGEILLVVIGILIALQINNWNQDRQKLDRELEIIVTFYAEITQNIEFTIDFKTKNEKRLDAIRKLLNLNMRELELISEEKLMQLMMTSAITDHYTPSVNKLNRILSMEELETDSSKIFISLLYNYNSSIQDIKVENKVALDTFMEKQVPLFNKNISAKNAMNQRWPDEITKSENEVNLKLFVKTLEFENVYSDIYATARGTSVYIDENLELMRQITLQIEEQYPITVKPRNKP